MTGCIEVRNNRLEETRRLLCEQLRMVKKDIEAYANGNRPVANIAALTTLLTLKHARAARLRSALSRIDAGTYGQCLSCAATIDSLRLATFPYAELCESCQCEAEKCEPRRGHVKLSRDCPEPRHETV